MLSLLHSSSSSLSPPGNSWFCLGEGSNSRSLGVPFTTLSWSCCPLLNTALPVPSPRCPTSTSSFLHKISSLQAPCFSPSGVMCVLAICHLVLSIEERVGHGESGYLVIRQRPERQSGERGWIGTVAGHCAQEGLGAESQAHPHR